MWQTTLGDLGLSEEQLFRVRQRVTQVHQKNLEAVGPGLGSLQDAFLHVYDLSAKLTFATSELLAVFFKLSGFHDHALRSLMRQEDVDHLQAKSQTGDHERSLTGQGQSVRWRPDGH